MSLLSFLHRPATVSLATTAPGFTGPAMPIRPAVEQPDPRVAVLAARLVEEHNREVRIARRVLRLEHLLVTHPDQAHRNCYALQQRCDQLRAEVERLELEVARLQGRKTEADWTGAFGRPA